ncbi:hypothetical protein GCM10008967_08470 [Bacillus carboniphilus]|uniref:Uncharacterized protein n=1 Tax=Bacillus carboniphilus TaxID=86663 RepID=A0ABN0VY39_9BACI
MVIWKWTKQIIIVALFLVATHFLYQFHLGAIPIFLFSFYLFHLAWKEIKKAKIEKQAASQEKNSEPDQDYEKRAKAK